MVPKMGHSYPRLGYKIGSHHMVIGCPGFFRNFRKSRAIHVSPKWPLFYELIADEDCQILGKNQGRGRMAETMPKMGHS